MMVFGQDSIGLFLLIGALTLSFVAIMVSLTASIVQLRKSKYDEMHQKAVLSSFRESYDNKASDLALEALATPSRWKDANHLVVAGANLNISSINTKPVRNEFLESLGIEPRLIEPDPNLVFVLTPFSKQEAGIFRTIKSVCEATGYRAMRGDEENVEGDILAHVIRQMLRAKIVIANIGSRNPNVFYELGIAHALCKPTILISKTLSDAPFDIQNRRIIVYKNTQTLEKDLAYALVRHSRNPNSAVN